MKFNLCVVRLLCLAAAAVILLANGCFAQAATTQPAWMKPQPAAMARWQAMRLGMFIHWGPVSLTGKEISWSRGTSTPIAVYDQLYKRFDPTQFNASAWVSLAKAAGMKYIVFTCKHHDGFCMFNTKLTNYNIMHTPFARDVTKELSDACKRQGIAFGAYYSVCDWHNPDFPLTSPGGRVKRPTSNIEAYNQYLLGHVKELITNYGPLLTIWNDVPQDFKGRGVREIKMVRTLQPDILINNRTGDGGDYLTPEQRIGKFDMTHPWESCMTLSAHNHWAWGGAKDGVKPLAKIVQLLVGCAGGDGNMLLNVGPEPTGIISPDQTHRLRQLGAWMHINGQSIYDTRGGPWIPTQSVASTRHGNNIYVHIMRWKKNVVTLPPIGRTITASSLLVGGIVKVDQAGPGSAILITVATADRQPIDTVVKLMIDGPAMSIAAIVQEQSK